VSALAYLLIRQQDRVGLYAFGGGEAPVYVPPRARSTHLHDLYGQLERSVDGANARGGKAAAGGPTALAAALDRIAETARRGRAPVGRTGAAARPAAAWAPT